MIKNNVPVVTIDGPVGSGKGTIARCLAEKLGWHLLDSGAFYRLTALAAMKGNIGFDDEESLARLVASLDVQFLAEGKIVLDGVSVEKAIRTEEVGAWASKIAKLSVVRQALHPLQRAFAKMPGLVADGRDMGTVVFKEANIKFYLIASIEARVQRRFLQLQAHGVDVTVAQLCADISARDEQDKNRAIAPLKCANDAVVIDSTKLTIQKVLDEMLTILCSKSVI